MDGFVNMEKAGFPREEWATGSAGRSLDWKSSEFDLWLKPKTPH